MQRCLSVDLDLCFLYFHAVPITTWLSGHRSFCFLFHLFFVLANIYCPFCIEEIFHITKGSLPRTNVTSTSGPRICNFNRHTTLPSHQESETPSSPHGSMPKTSVTSTQAPNRLEANPSQPVNAKTLSTLSHHPLVPLPRLIEPCP